MLFAKNEKELETSIQAINIYGQDIGIGFAIDICVMLIVKSRKRETTYGIELQNQEKIRTLGKEENDRYSEILEACPSNKQR